MIRQSMAVAREAVDFFGVKPTTFKQTKELAAAALADVTNAIETGNKEQMLSNALYLKELVDFAVYAAEKQESKDGDSKKQD